MPIRKIKPDLIGQEICAKKPFYSNKTIEKNSDKNYQLEKTVKFQMKNRNLKKYVKLPIQKKGLQI